ncbi:MAG: DUF423 domain-containing protein [Glaciecola sp.]
MNSSLHQDTTADSANNEQQVLYFWLSIGAVLSAISILLGAFGAHGLKRILNAYELGLIDTAVQYLMFHSLSICFISLLPLGFLHAQQVVSIFSRVNALLLAGCVLFSGSLCAYALTGAKWLVFLTPIGGSIFVVAWLWLAFICIRNRKKT